MPNLQPPSGGQKYRQRPSAVKKELEQHEEEEEEEDDQDEHDGYLTEVDEQPAQGGQEGGSSPPGNTTFGNDDGESSDAKRLAAFIATVHDDLHVVVRLRGDLLSAPEAGEAQDRRATLLDAMGRAWPDAAQTVPALIEQVLQADRLELERAGLVGPQLDFKLLAWNEQRHELLEAFADSTDLEPQGPEPPAVLPQNVVNANRPWSGSAPIA